MDVRCCHFPACSINNCVCVCVCTCIVMFITFNARALVNYYLLAIGHFMKL